jgi:hypothetical protein
VDRIVLTARDFDGVGEALRLTLGLGLALGLGLRLADTLARTVWKGEPAGPASPPTLSGVAVQAVRTERPRAAISRGGIRMSVILSSGEVDVLLCDADFHDPVRRDCVGNPTAAARAPPVHRKADALRRYGVVACG